MPHSPAFAKLRQLIRQASGKASPQSALEQIDHSRRDFIKKASALGGLSLMPLSACVRLENLRPRIAILGSGIAGLTAGWTLKKAGIDADIYERSNQSGGRIKSVPMPGHPGTIVEAGGTFINSDHGHILALADEFGVEMIKRPEYPERTDHGFYLDNRLLTNEEIVRDLGPIAEQIATDAERIETDSDYSAHLDSLSVEQYLDSHADKIRAPYIRKLLESAIRSEWGSESRSTSSLLLLDIMPTVENNQPDPSGGSDELYRVKGGTQRLTDKMAEALKDQIKYGHKLTRLRSDRFSCTLQFNNQSHGTEYDAVIVTLPFSALRPVPYDIKGLSPELAQYIREAQLGSNEKIIEAFNGQPWKDHSPFGKSLRSDTAAQVWDESQNSDGKTGALTYYFGGDETARIDRAPVIAMLGEIMPGLAATSAGKTITTSWKGSYPTFPPGQLTRFADCFWGENQKVRAGAVIFAGQNVANREYNGYMEGAVQTGQLAAREVMSVWGLVNQQ